MNANGHDEYAALPDRMIAVIMGIEKPKAWPQAFGRE